MDLHHLLPILVLAACLPSGDDDGDDTTVDDDSTADDPTPAPPETGTLTAENDAGRHGSYSLPVGWNLGPVPLLVLFHATGGDGASIQGQFQTLADQQGLAIVAPDSRQSPQGDWTWEVGTDPGEVTPDLEFAMLCVDEILGRGLGIDGVPVLSAGHSGGASMAPYLATNDPRFTHFAVLHGGVYTTAWGENPGAGWFSTGTDDTIRPPDLVQAAMVEAQAAGFADVEYHEFPGGHGLSAQETHDVVAWWTE